MNTALFPLMMSVVKIGDELSAAALTRGLGGLKHRTTIANIGFTFYDAIIAILSAGLANMGAFVGRCVFLIEFQNVTFTYQSTERESGVYNLNLHNTRWTGRIAVRRVWLWQNDTHQID